MKNLGIALVALAVLCSPARADDSSRAVAQELVDYTIGKTTNDIIAKMSSAMWASLQASLPKTVDDGTVADLRVVFDRVLTKYVTEAMKVAPDIYARHFSADELRGLLAFYKTPLGTKMLAETPKVMGDFTSSALMPMMAPMQAELKDSIDEVMRNHGMSK